jgi:hypothetical protein
MNPQMKLRRRFSYVLLSYSAISLPLRKTKPSIVDWRGVASIQNCIDATPLTPP